MKLFRRALLALATTGLAFASMQAPARAQGVADFYRGKTITLYTPDTPGSGYDAYARLVSRFMTEKIPGNPAIVVQNMPGGGGLVQTNYIYNNAPTDGTAMAIIMHGAIFRPIFDPREVRYKMDGFRYLGSAAPIIVIGAFNKDAPAQTAADMFTKETPIGSSGGTTQYFPDAINRLLGTKFKLVSGYRGSNEVVLAMQRNEVAGVVGIGLDSLLLGLPMDKVNVLFQIGSVRSKELPNVPLIQELAKTEEERKVIEAVSASVSIGRVFVTPKIPDDRQKALNTAFEQALKDPQLLEQAAKQRMVVNFISPEQIEGIAKTVYAFPEPVLKRAGEIMAGNY